MYYGLANAPTSYAFGIFPALCVLSSKREASPFPFHSLRWMSLAMNAASCPLPLCELFFSFSCLKSLTLFYGTAFRFTPSSRRQVIVPFLPLSFSKLISPPSVGTFLGCVMVVSTSPFGVSFPNVHVFHWLSDPSLQLRHCFCFDVFSTIAIPSSPAPGQTTSASLSLRLSVGAPLQLCCSPGFFEFARV